MLSYRHAFHAGNHADVLKHWVEVLCIQYLKQKDKPFFYIDTHAGAGLYALLEGYAAKTGEYRDGIGRLFSHQRVPSVFDDYLNVVRACNEQALKFYPGSPLIAAQLLREDDRLRLVEMHSADVTLLEQHLGSDPRARIISGDGFEQIRALLPPSARRGLILVDPPYEVKEDYSHVLEGVQEGLKRFATGTYLVWYPLLSITASQKLPVQLKKLHDNWLNVQLRVSAKPYGHGMYGSGLFVINPPWLLHDQLQQGLPYLVRQLGQDDAAGHVLETSASP